MKRLKKHYILEVTHMSMVHAGVCHQKRREIIHTVKCSCVITNEEQLAQKEEMNVYASDYSFIYLLKAASPVNRTGSPQGFSMFKPYSSPMTLVPKSTECYRDVNLILCPPMTNTGKHLTDTTRNIKCIKIYKHSPSAIVLVYNSTQSQENDSIVDPSV